MYAVLDIETTGGKFNEEGITEIAIYRFDGHQVTDRLISLINPEREIQDFVVKLTGINNRMLRNAPKFYEIAKRIIEITDGCTIVAHNALFDYRILRTEFRRLGYDYQRDRVCTVELSKRLIPGKESYSLGKLVRSLGIPVSDRHRANGDAMATLELFKLLLSKDTQKNIITQAVKSESENQMPAKLLRIVDTLPSKMGVYYIHNKEGEIIFLGKSKNIRKRVNLHFASTSKRDKRIQKEVQSVTFEETGIRLIAELKELEEIRQNQPKYNTKKRKNYIKYGLYSRKDSLGYLNFYIENFSTDKDAISTFETIHQAQNILYKITEEFTLCPKLMTLSQAKKSCHNHTIGKCNGACVSKELSEDYNQRAEQAIEKYKFPTDTVVITERGRESGEKSFLLIENGVFKGYGFVALNYQLSHLNMLRDILSPMEDSTLNRHLIQKFLQTNHAAKKIILKS